MSAELKTVNSERNHTPAATWPEVSDDTELSRQIKGECLAKYCERKPKLFVQIDCFGPNSAGDCVIDPDSTGRGISLGTTWELMRGTPVRILIGDEYSDDPELLAALLIDAAASIRRDPRFINEAVDHELKRVHREKSEIPF